MSLRTAALAVLLLVAGCTSSGRDFDPDPLTQLVPGYTTLPQAAALMRAYPVQTYAAADGAFHALWSYHVTSLNHLLYRKSALVHFNADGTFERVVDTSGVVGDAAQHRSQLANTRQACMAPEAVCP